jgi:hypothetical protein
MSNGQSSSFTASIQRSMKATAEAGTLWPGRSPTNGCSGAFDPETTVTFVLKEVERALNDAAFIDICRRIQADSLTYG